MQHSRIGWNFLWVAWLLFGSANGFPGTTAIGGERTKVEITSSVDGTPQPCYVILPSEYDSQAGPVPLLVSLHSWSGDVEQRNAGLEQEADRRGWIYLFPHFRGPNNRPEACGSSLAQQDILDSVAWARQTYKIDPARIYLTGSSGGGHMTLLMAGRHPEIWAAASAWVGITDLAAWHRKHAGSRYGQMLEASCGGAPGSSDQVDAQYKQRSPLSHLHRAKNLPIDIAAGIHDGHTGSVPIDHSLRAFNVLARVNGGLPVPNDEMAQLLKRNGQLAERRVSDRVEDPALGRAIHLRRHAGPARVTIFEGGHEGIASAAAAWLSRHRKPAPSPDESQTVPPRVQRPEAASPDLASKAQASKDKKKPVQVFILAGQSNMEGKAKLSLLEYQAQAPETSERFAHLKNDQGEWSIRNDVSIKFLDRKGGLTVGFGSRNCIGPELDFGHVVGDHYDEPVLIIKTAWGGKSLYRDFRPPSSGLPSEQVLNQLLLQAQKRKPETTLDDVKQSFGHYYREMIREVESTLADLPTHFPQYEGHDYELAGMVWFQGWNDMINPDYTAEYADHMANFIRDVRNELDAPGLPFVIGQLGVGGTRDERPNPKRDAFKEAQAKPASLAEFQGNVVVVKTDQYWDQTADAVFKKGWREHLEEWNKVGSDYPYHYLGSARCYSDIGRAFAEALLKLQ